MTDSAGYDDTRIPQERVVQSCALCRQTRIFVGEFAVEKAQMWLEDGGHYCIDVLGDEACPECETGVVVEVGHQCRETGHTPIACSDNCGWTS